MVYPIGLLKGINNADRDSQVPGTLQAFRQWNYNFPLEK